MRRRNVSIQLIAFVVAAIVPSFAGPGPATATLEGTWVLVEQTYGKGGSDLAESDVPIRLRIERTASGVSAWVWHGENAAGALAWPALVADERELRATTRSVRIEEGRHVIHGHCQLVPVEGEDLVLNVRESYTLSPDGRSLSGTVEVTLKGGPHNRGGYTLVRRFERER